LAVRAVLLHNQRRFIKVRPTIRYSDLHRFHHVLRKDLQTDLVRSQAFSTSFKGEVERASAAREIPERVAGAENTAVAAEKHAAIAGAVGESVKAFARKGYAAFRQDSAWKPQFDAAASNAADFKQKFGNVLRTDVSTAFDHLVNNPRRQWLDWLDILIDRKDEKADERLMFSAFVRAHPGVDALGGTWRGGTLVLVYDDSGAVVADLALPYRVADDDDDDDEPELPVAPPPPLVGGIKLIKPLDLLTVNLRDELKTSLLAEVNIQRELGKNFSDSIVKFGEVFNVGKTAGVRPGLVGDIRDVALEGFTRRADVQRAEVESLRERILDPGVPEATRTELRKQLGDAEAALGKTVQEGTRYIVANKVDTASSGGDGALALARFTQGASAINSTTVRKELGTSLSRIETEARTGNALPQADALANFRVVGGFGG
jgi:hypothetical protein